MDNRFERTELLIGKKGLEKLQESSIAVFGVGGVGSFVVEALARTGIGSFLLVDFDRVDITNINRQIPALSHTVGLLKVEVMAERINHINPAASVECLEIFCTQDNIDSIINGRKLEYIVDAVDNVTAKIHIIKVAHERQIPVISSMGAGNKLDPTKLQIADISRTHTCPLARDVRKSLKKVGIFSGVETVFSTEKPLKPIRQLLADSGKVIPGSISFLPSTVGLYIAGRVVNTLIKSLIQED